MLRLHAPVRPVSIVLPTIQRRAVKQCQQVPRVRWRDRPSRVHPARLGGRIGRQPLHCRIPKDRGMALQSEIRGQLQTGQSDTSVSHRFAAQENRMRPVLNDRYPVRRLKIVDLPAPFGPINEVIVLRSTAKLTSSTAVRAPKRRVNFSAIKMASVNWASPGERKAAPHCVRFRSIHQVRKKPLAR